jgi:hypothetical protein
VTSTEGSPFAAHHHREDVRVGEGSGEGGGEAVAEGSGEGVDGRIVEGKKGDATVYFVLDRTLGGSHQLGEQMKTKRRAKLRPSRKMHFVCFYFISVNV